MVGSWPARLRVRHASAVRRSCQTMARWIGLPVRRSQTTQVSRWLVMPMAAMSLGAQLGGGQRLPGGLDRRAPDVLGIVLHPARGRIVLGELALCEPQDAQIGAEHDGAARRGALIDRQHRARLGHGVLQRGSDPSPLRWHLKSDVCARGLAPATPPFSRDSMRGAVPAARDRRPGCAPFHEPALLSYLADRGAVQADTPLSWEGCKKRPSDDAEAPSEEEDL